MPSSREIKPSSDEKRLNGVEKPKSPDTWRRICKQADQANRDTSSALSSSRDTGKRPLSAWEVKQLEEMPLGKDGKPVEKLVIPERGLKGGMGNCCGKYDKEASTSSSSYDSYRLGRAFYSLVQEGRDKEAIKICNRLIDNCQGYPASTRNAEIIVSNIINAFLDQKRDKNAIKFCNRILAKLDIKGSRYVTKRIMYNMLESLFRAGEIFKEVGGETIEFRDRLRDKYNDKYACTDGVYVSRYVDRVEASGLERRYVSPSPPRKPSPLEIAENLYKELPYYHQAEINPSQRSPEKLLREDPSFIDKIYEKYWSWNNCDNE